MKLGLSPKEIPLLCQGLVLRSNYIQTGSVILSAQDALIQGKQSQVKLLTQDQKALLLQLKEIEKKLLTNGEFNSAEVNEMLTALSMRCCYIETGTVTMRATDAISRGNPDKVCNLSESQQQTLRKLEELVTKLYRNLLK